MAFKIINLERVERMNLEEPEMAFDYLEMELIKQVERLSIDRRSFGD